MRFFLISLFLINAAGFLVMTADKQYAKKKMWRIPERTLMALARLGGSAGVLLAMYTVRHKTRHPKFYIGVPAILLCQVVLLLWFFTR